MPLFGPPNIEKLKFNRDVKGLMNAMSFVDDGGEIRLLAIKALKDIGSTATDFLLNGLLDHSAGIRYAAADALGELRTFQAVQPLINVLHDSNAVVRSSAATALGRIGNAKSVQPLIQCLQDGDARVVDASAMALAEIGDASAVQPLIEMLGSSDHKQRIASQKALKRFGGPALDALTLTLTLGNDHARFGAITVLGEISDKRTLPALITALSDIDAYVVQAARMAILKYGSDAVPQLINLLKSNDQKLKAVAANLIVELSESMQPALVTAIHSWDEELREQAVNILGRIAKPWVEMYLITALQDASVSVRFAAAQSLGRIRAPKATGPLTESLGDPNEYVRDAAAKALKEIQAQGKTPAIGKDKFTPPKISYPSGMPQNIVIRMDEIVHIGYTSGYIGNDPLVFDELHRHRRVVEIGEELYQSGGVRLLQAAHGLVCQYLSEQHGSALAQAWKNLGRK